MMTTVSFEMAAVNEPIFSPSLFQDSLPTFVSLFSHLEEVIHACLLVSRPASHRGRLIPWRAPARPKAPAGSR
jgi:hypothetical protein